MNEEFDRPYDDDEKVVLTDEDGNDVEFEFCASIEYEGKEYVVLLPDDEDEVVILQVVEPEDGDDSDDVTYVTVDDDNVLEAVFEIFREQAKDEYDFEDDGAIKSKVRTWYGPFFNDHHEERFFQPPGAGDPRPWPHNACASY